MNGRDEMDDHTERRFRELVFVILAFGPTIASFFLARWLQRTIPGLPTLLEYALLSLPALVVAAILFAFKPRVLAWFRTIDQKREEEQEE